MFKLYFMFLKHPICFYYTSLQLNKREHALKYTI